MSAHDIIVIGGGPAGLMAASTAASLGADVLLIERMPRIGSKLRITGKGKCNITNTRDLQGFREKVFGPESAWVHAFERFTNEDIITLLHRLGVETVVERGDRVYPASHQAADVADALTRHAEQSGARLELNTRAIRLSPNPDSTWEVEVAPGPGLRGSPAGPGNQPTRTILGRAVVMSTGGQSYPRTGSDGLGYDLLRRIGHQITPLYPALVGFHTVPRLIDQGRYTLRNVGVEARAAGHSLGQEFGEIELTPEGVGGSAILRVSREVVLAHGRGEIPVLTLDLKPARTTSQLEARIMRDATARAEENLYSLARSWLPAVLVSPVLKFSNISRNLTARRLQRQDVERLAKTMKGLRLRVTGHEDWNRAVCTGGGLPWTELHHDTYESRLHPGLYACGELLDLDANTGGFNLQLAYSTGVVAGEAAARRVLNLTSPRGQTQE